MFKPRPRMELLPLEGGPPCLVVDDALSEPGRWVELAARHAAEFAVDPHAGHPVRRLVLPGPVLTQLDVYFSEFLRDLLGFRRVLDAQGWLSLATAGSPRPSRASTHLPGQGTAVFSLCLFEDATLGGTVFPDPRAGASAPPLGRVAARYNRLVVFDGGRWHAPDIGPAVALPDDPRRGRLTLDARFTCRRRAQ